MTDRQARFVDEYILNGGNSAEAARRAGYAEAYAAREGYRLLRNAEVRAAIDEQLNKIASEKTVQQAELIEFLSSVIRGEVKDEQLMTRLIGKGQSVIERHEYRASVKDRLRACELLCKIYCMFKEKQEEQRDALQEFVDALTRANAEQ